MIWVSHQTCSGFLNSTGEETDVDLLLVFCSSLFFLPGPGSLFAKKSLATCHECNGLTWGGCGLHVESLLSTIPAGARICNCPIRRR
ncbi:hypothetical protein PGT21_028678 [Puccinia graminis f. sp. tritici]|uniref:Uncharacterized protein n=1 Tax=Puccinia graminis f. sp. tritici TaxID=56615 RepID=A0A5B0QKX6_PUCGR|nr:hypothetical protein PGT21_028678 [Puccinia graminis f. sp. tritici]KAA1113887.1 hypothetical protein PGTUg99_011565 [Puccinia graminis f. sp. tritici]